MMTEDEQCEMRSRMRTRWENDLAFNRRFNFAVERWDAEGVDIAMPYHDDLTTRDGYLHGGVLAALVDTAACGAVAAGHDYSNGNRVTTVAMSVQYLSAARREDVVAEARCTKRGRSMQFAEVKVRTRDGRALVEGVVTMTAINQPNAGS